MPSNLSYFAPQQVYNTGAPPINNLSSLDWNSFAAGYGQQYDSRNLLQQRQKDIQNIDAQRAQDNLQADHASWLAQMELEHPTPTLGPAQPNQTTPQVDAMSDLQATMNEEIAKLNQQSQALLTQSNSMIQQAQQRTQQQQQAVQSAAQQAAAQSNAQYQQAMQVAAQPPVAPYVPPPQQQLPQFPPQQQLTPSGIPVQYVQQMQIATNAFTLQPSQLTQLGYSPQQAQQIAALRQAIDNEAVSAWNYTHDLDKTAEVAMWQLVQNLNTNASALGLDINIINQYGRDAWIQAMYPFVRDMTERRLRENGLL
jgi:hypothetical protein